MRTLTRQQGREACGAGAHRRKQVRWCIERVDQANTAIVDVATETSNRGNRGPAAERGHGKFNQSNPGGAEVLFANAARTEVSNMRCEIPPVESARDLRQLTLATAQIERLRHEQNRIRHRNSWKNRVRAPGRRRSAQPPEKAA